MKRTCLCLLGVALILASCDQSNKSPEKLSKEKKFELSEKCSIDGKAYFDDFWKSTNLAAYQSKTKYSWDDPEYHYSERLNTCLIHIRYVEFDTTESYLSTHYNQVIDVFSNKTILRGWFIRNVRDNTEKAMDTGDNVPNVISTEYFRRKAALFSE